MKEVAITGTETAGEVLLKTLLYDTHIAYKGKIVPFAGRLLPVQYETGTIEEHTVARTKYGLFDASHMGEVICKGPDALKNLNMLLANDYAAMTEGQVKYSPMCNEQGGVMDGLIVYKVRNDYYFIAVSAADEDKDHVWMKTHQPGDVVFDDISSQVAQPTLQGPKAMDVPKKATKEEDIPEKYYACPFDYTMGGTKYIISKTGYTGENEVGIYLASEDAPKIWELLMEVGKDEDLIPCGLGARDTLRLEAGMPLYGHEIDDTIFPGEAGLGIFVKMDKDDFIGKQAIQDEGPLTKKRVGLEVTGRGIIGEHQPVYTGEQQVGMTTSGIHCPLLGYPVAMTLVDIGFEDSGTALEVDVRGRRAAAGVTKLPFYKRQQFMEYNKQVFKI